MRRPHIEILPSGSASARISDPRRPGVRMRITGSEAEVRRKVEAASQIAKEIRSGEVDPKALRRRFLAVAAGAPTVEEIWKAHWATLRGQWRKKCESIWRVQLARLGHLRAWELTPERMATWETEERKKRGAKTVENAWHALRAAYRASLGERIEEIPWRKWRPQGPPRGQETRESCRSMGELESLIVACAAHDAEARRRGEIGDLAVRVLVACFTGLRQGELVALRWSAVAIDGEEARNLRLFVRANAYPDWASRLPEPTDPPKGNKVRDQVLHRSAAAALRAQRDRIQALGLYRVDGPVFPTIKGTFRRGARCIEPALFRAIVAAAGLPTDFGKRWVVHSTRHTFATLEVQAAFMTTGDVQTARKRTGHDRVETLMGYLGRVDRGAPMPLMGELGTAALGAATGLTARLLGSGDAQAIPITPEAAATRKALAGLVGIAAPSTPAKESAHLRGKSPERAAASLRHLAALVLSLPGGAPPGEVPVQVERSAQARYRAAYARAQRRGASPETCKAAGGRAQRGYLGAWAKVLAAAQRERAAGAIASVGKLDPVAVSDGDAASCGGTLDSDDFHGGES